ncbi:MAG: N-acetyltransferase [Clostridia bacterium]|jgi:RimJ/RimL family protein N-acetyltransferase|nr:N-acetyltransferase [Clostridia bacterium]
MIIGEKTIIRPMEMKDIDFIHKWWNIGEAMEYSGLKYGFMLSKAALENLFKAQIESSDMYLSDEKMFIICSKENMSPMGDISYRNWNKHSRSAEIGLEICDPADRGKGYGRDAMIAFINFMFRHLNLHRIELTTAESNKAAQALYYRLGFKAIGIIRDSYYSPMQDNYVNALYMDLLSSDWDKAKDNERDRYI